MRTELFLRQRLPDLPGQVLRGSGRQSQEPGGPRQPVEREPEDEQPGRQRRRERSGCIKIVLKRFRKISLKGP